jgi:hypothetical protein
VDFKPFQAPDNDYASLNAGLSTEGGVTAKGLVEGVNAYFSHLFKVVGGRMGDVIDAIDGEARERIVALEEAVAALQMKLDAMSTPPATPPVTVGAEPEKPLEALKAAEGAIPEPAKEPPALTVGGA